MPKLRAPIEKEAVISEFHHRDPNIRITLDDPIVVKFRQVREGGIIERQQLLSSPITRQWITEDNGTEPGYQEQLRLTPAGLRMAIDTYLSMTHCNIEAVSGDLVFDIPKGKTAAEYYGSLQEYLKVWGSLYPEWASLIWEECLDVNPSFGFSTAEDDEGDEYATPGEEEASEEAESNTLPSTETLNNFEK